MTKIAEIQLTAFRGIRSESIALNGASLFLYGENGSGKSSIIDSLEFFFTGAVAHLEGVQSLSTKRHAPHVSFAADQASVGIRFQGHETTLKRTLKHVTLAPKALTPVVERLAQSRFILRRQQLLDFIMDQAAPRYAQLARLIGADELDGIELPWRSAVDEARSRLEALDRRIEEAQATFEVLLGKGTAFASEEAIVGALNNKLGAHAFAGVATLAEVEARKSELLTAAGHKERAAQAVQLEQLRVVGQQTLERLAGLGVHEGLWTGVDALRTAAEQLREIRFREVLAKARELIRQYEPSVCPVCEQAIDANGLVEDLTNRIIRSDALATQVRTLDDRRANLLQDLTKLRGLLQKIVAGVSTDTTLGSVHATAVKAENWCMSFAARLTEEVHRLELGAFSEFAQAEVVGQLTAACKQLHEGLSSRIEKLAETETDRRLVELIALLTRSVDTYRTYTDAVRARIIALREVEALARIYETLVDTKKALIQNIYNELEADIASFYDVIHPDEAHGDIKLAVVPGRRGSAEIRMGFASAGSADPRAYNSEAHLDSLGLCIFLAFAKRFNGDVKILALDDVVSSVDASHRARVCRLLFSEFAEYQLIVTTHDELWFEQLLAHHRAMKFSPVRARRIITWTLEDGPQFADHKPRWDVIEAKLGSGDKQGAASLCRKSLEWTLFELALALTAQVSLRRDARYDVGALLDPVLARAKKLIPNFEAANQEVLTRFKSSLLIGNLLTHHNAFADGASVADVRAFTDATKELHDIFWCEHCGGFVQYVREAKVVTCRCAEGGKRWSVA